MRLIKTVTSPPSAPIASAGGPVWGLNIYLCLQDTPHLQEGESQVRAPSVTRCAQGLRERAPDADKAPGKRLSQETGDGVMHTILSSA